MSSQVNLYVRKGGYHTPGVYFETTDPVPREIGEVRTDIAGFVGVAERGPLHHPIRVQSWTQFRTRFGAQTPDGYLAYAVYGFFANGGRTCWVVRVGDDRPGGRLASLSLADRTQLGILRVEARDPGPGSKALRVRLEQAPGSRFSLLVRIDDVTLETWKNLSMDRNDPQGRYVGDVINDGYTVVPGERTPELTRADLPDFSGSVLIQVQDLTDSTGSSTPTQILASPDHEEAGLGAEAEPTDVLDGLTLDHFTGENTRPGVHWGLACLERIEEVSMVAIPDLMWPGKARPEPPKPIPPDCRKLTHDSASSPASEVSTRPILSDDDRLEGQRAMLRHCAKLKDRFGIFDSPWGLTPNQVVGWADSLRSEAGQYGGLYYPWIYVPDPLKSPGQSIFDVPASGHCAGMTARVDLSAGVHKPPANERLEDAVAPILDVDGPIHGMLNDAGVNLIRAYPKRGVRVAGARTLVDYAPDHRVWQFVNVRRLLLMIEHSIVRSTQWVVFEPNRPDRWRAIDRVVRNFLDGLWRAGKLDGASATQAYSVVCDETSNPPEEIDLGKMICVIGVQPPKPAEFVVVRLGRTADQTGSSGEGRDVVG